MVDKQASFLGRHGNTYVYVPNLIGEPVTSVLRATRPSPVGLRQVENRWCRSTLRDS